jgi:hypothetical protein
MPHAAAEPLIRAGAVTSGVGGAEVREEAGPVSEHPEENHDEIPDQPRTDRDRIEATRKRMAHSNGDPLSLVDPDEAWDWLRHLEDAS